MEKIKHIFLVCGEPSGDINAANLVRRIKELNPGIRISAVGGQNLRLAGAEVFYDIEELAVIGLFDVLKKLPRFMALKELILDKIKKEKPDAIVLVDFSGFNLRLAKVINKGIPVIYYISPQVWASRRGRLKTIKEYVSKMIVLFKFEQEFYKKYGIDVEYVGHPLLDIPGPSADKERLIEEFNIYSPKDIHATIALLPGSRTEEVKRILPLMLKAAWLIRQTIDRAQFIVVKSSQVSWDVYHPITHKYKIDLKVIEGRTYDCLNIADFAIVTSGTATLEAAIIQKPFIAVYKTSLFNYLLYRPQIKIPYISLVNILAGKKIVPELIQLQATPRKIASQSLNIINTLMVSEELKKKLSGIKPLLGEKGASLRAAQIILNYLNG